MQYNLGTITATNGHQTITGTGVDWSPFLSGFCYLMLAGTNTYINVLQVRPPENNASGKWEADLAANFQGAPDAGPWTTKAYYLGNTASPNFELPLMNNGDKQGQILYTQAMLLIDKQLKATQDQIKDVESDILISLRPSDPFRVMNDKRRNYALTATFAPFNNERPLLSSVSYIYDLDGTAVSPTSPYSHTDGELSITPSALFNRTVGFTHKGVFTPQFTKLRWHVYIPPSRDQSKDAYYFREISFSANVLGRNWFLPDKENTVTSWQLEEIL